MSRLGIGHTTTLFYPPIVLCFLHRVYFATDERRMFPCLYSMFALTCLSHCWDLDRPTADPMTTTTSSSLDGGSKPPSSDGTLPPTNNANATRGDADEPLSEASAVPNGTSAGFEWKLGELVACPPKL